MKKQNVNFSWPVTLSDFKKDEKTETFSRGKLKVFYQGETPDHRYFSEKFSKDLVKSIYYTPIVSYYDEKKDDFVGHASNQQIFGIVDPCVQATFEKDEDGITWCVCDVVMYTERPDKVGEWAKKIVGHKQSLELDPTSVKYVINYDEKKHFKNIEFTAGRFIGVSVLGNDQKPAFTGSEFFAYNEDFENKMKILKNYCEEQKGQIPQLGGKDMNLQEFIKLSWGDISVKVGETISKEYENDAFTYIVDMFEDSAIVRFCYYMEGTCKLMRVKYSIDNDEVKLGAVNEVHITYEDIIEEPKKENAERDIAQAECKKDDAENCECGGGCDKKKENCGSDESNAECGGSNNDKEKKSDCECGGKDKKEDCECNKDKKEDCECGKDKKEDCECKRPANHPDVKPGDPLPEGHPDIDDDDDDKDDDKDDDDDCFTEKTAQDANVEITPEVKKVSVDSENNEQQQQNIEENTSSTSFTESERAEFETLKREKKIALVDSYKDSLNDDEYKHFVDTIDSFEEKDLELELLKVYKNHQQNQKPMRAFAFAPTTNNAKNENSLDSFVKKYKNK